MSKALAVAVLKITSVLNKEFYSQRYVLMSREGGGGGGVNCKNGFVHKKYYVYMQAIVC
jgi:hypothetical protein